MKTQCRFQKGNTHTIGWIDSKYAKLGLYVQLLDFGLDFWEVVAVGGSSEKDMAHRHKTYNNNI